MITSSRSEAQTNRGFAFLTKPFKVEEMVSTVRRAISTDARTMN